MFEGRVYLAGPMSGLPESNYPAFHRAAKVLRTCGFEVVSPAELHPDGPRLWDQARASGDQACMALWRTFMRKDLRELMLCGGIFYLDGTEDSQGAQIEVRLAAALGFEVVQQLSEITIRQIEALPPEVVQAAQSVLRVAVIEGLAVEIVNIPAPPGSALHEVLRPEGAADPYAGIPKAS